MDSAGHRPLARGVASSTETHRDAGPAPVAPVPGRGAPTVSVSRLPGGPRAWTYLSGLAELACATAVANGRTRRAGAPAAAGLFVAVFPGNVKMAVDWRHRPLPQRTIAYGRLPLQVPLVLWALRVARSSEDSAGHLGT